jgi:hypothetical protein
MKGKILDFDIKEGKGVITGDDSKRYYFIVAEWESEKSPQVNQNVDFDIDGNNAIKIYVLNNKIDIDIDSISKNSSENIQAIQKKIGGSFSNGIRNKSGFIVSIILIFLTFLPFRPFSFDNVSLISYSFFGKILFLLFVLLALGFYSGIKKEYMKKLGLVSGIYGSLYALYSLITIKSALGLGTVLFGPNKSDIEDIILYGLLLIFIFIFSLIALFFSRKKSYIEN